MMEVSDEKRGRNSSTVDESSSGKSTGFKPSNINILVVAACSFGLFVIAEIIGAIASHSLSLLGDGAAMSIDVITYISNMYAERMKAKNNGILAPRQKIIFEVLIPSFSVSALLGVTGYILSDAINVIQNGDNEDVNVYFLFAFAGGNFLVDIVSSVMFYLRGKEVLISSPADLVRHSQDLADNSKGSSTNLHQHDLNLNMMSALTHVGSDTLRTTSVFIAAIISKAFHQNSSLCDAWAAVVVSITIVFAVIPLILEIRKAWFSTQELNKRLLEVDLEV